MQSSQSSVSSSSLTAQLKSSLLRCNQHRYPHVPNPEGCKKRASVALIIRVRPKAAGQAPFQAEQLGRGAGSDHARIESFFNLDWVQRGDPEVLFIKRAARQGDRWTGHIAFPGGRRDPEDEDDAATSTRETKEEIGLDLNVEHCLRVGNLSERIVTTWLGKTPLMVLCPFVYLLMRFDAELLTLEPAEVHSAHWVPLWALLSPDLNTFTSSDVSGRFGISDGHLSRGLNRLLFGRILIKAIHLVPTESVFCIPSPGSLPSTRNALTGSSATASPWFSTTTGLGRSSETLTLWGLTLGIMSDFLRTLPACDTSNLWAWPTLSPPDYRLLIWLFTYTYRKQKMQELGSRKVTSQNSGEAGSELSGPGELDNTTFTAIQARSREAVQDSALLEILGGYYDRAKTAVLLTLLLRIGAGSFLVAWLIRKYRNRFTPRL